MLPVPSTGGSLFSVSDSDVVLRRALFEHKRGGRDHALSPISEFMILILYELLE